MQDKPVVLLKEICDESNLLSDRRRILAELLKHNTITIVGATCSGKSTLWRELYGEVLDRELFHNEEEGNFDFTINTAHIPFEQPKELDESNKLFIYVKRAARQIAETIYYKLDPEVTVDMCEKIYQSIEGLSREDILEAIEIQIENDIETIEKFVKQNNNRTAIYHSKAVVHSGK